MNTEIILKYLNFSNNFILVWETKIDSWLLELSLSWTKIGSLIFEAGLRKLEKNIWFEEKIRMEEKVKKGHYSALWPRATVAWLTVPRGPSVAWSTRQISLYINSPHWFHRGPTTSSPTSTSTPNSTDFDCTELYINIFNFQWRWPLLFHLGHTWLITQQAVSLVQLRRGPAGWVSHLATPSRILNKL